MGTTPCPHRKTVTRGLRCPDCTLAHRQGENRRLLERIQKATPPAPVDAGEGDEVDDRYVAEDRESEDAGDADEDENDEQGEDAVHPPAPVARKPEHRQAPKPKDRVTGELPWWATRGRDGFTEAATAKRDEMTAEARRRGITVEGKVNS